MAGLLLSAVAAMRLDRAQDLLQTLVKQRNFAYIVALVMGVSNVGLMIYVNARQERFVLVPQFNMEHQTFVTPSDFSDSYLIDWADGVIRMVFTVNPNSVDRRIVDVLRLAVAGRGEIQKNLAVWEKRVKRDGIATVFYPKSFIVHKAQHQVVIQGTLYSYFGSDRKPILEEKTYLVGYAPGHRGLLYLDRLQEKTHE
jgi:type IV conjugative transfer system protein TraE